MKYRYEMRANVKPGASVLRYLGSSSIPVSWFLFDLEMWLRKHRKRVRKVGSKSPDDLLQLVARIALAQAVSEQK